MVSAADAGRLAATGWLGRARGWIWARLAAERERWVLWSPVGVGAGIAAYFALPTEPPPWAGLLVLAATLAATLAAIFATRSSWRNRRPSGGRSGILAPAVAVAVFAAGFAAAQLRTAAVDAPALEQRLGPTSITGRVERVEPRGAASRITLTDVGIGELAVESTPARVRLSLRGEQPDLRPGDRVRLRGVVMPPPAPSAPGAFDFQRQSFFQGLGAVGFAYGRAEVVSASRQPGGWRVAMARLRQDVGARIRDHLSGVTGAVATALITGQRGNIPAPVLAAIREAGLAHLLAISGLHIGLVAGVLFGAARGLLALVAPVALRFPIKKWAAAVALLGAVGYGALAGASVPTQRALLMIGLVLVAVMLDRRGLSMRAVAWAALLILVLAPESLLTASFQLSFAAVVALIAVYEVVRDLRLRPGGERTWPEKALLYIGGVGLTTMVAGAATAPFVMFHFNQLAGYGLAANLVAVPITALWVMPWAVATLMLMPLGLEGLALAPMGWGVDAVLRVAEAVSRWPGAVTHWPAAPTWALACVGLGGLWLCLWRTRWRLLGLGGIAIGLAAFLMVRPPDVLVDAEGKLMAVRTASGTLAVSSLKVNRFGRRMWLNRYGQGAEPVPWPKRGYSADGSLVCDALGCVYRADDGRLVAIARTAEAVDEDCRTADVVVSTVPIRSPCPAPETTIDRFDLWREGAHALWLEDGQVRVESVNARRGDRPWVVRPDR